VNVFPLLNILDVMKEQLAYNNHNLEKSLEFLFNSCNMKKLSRQLKHRNIKHNIMSLSHRLDKQRFLAFAIEFAKTADLIAKGRE